MRSLSGPVEMHFALKSALMSVVDCHFSHCALLLVLTIFSVARAHFDSKICFLQPSKFDSLELNFKNPNAASQYKYIPFLIWHKFWFGFHEVSKSYPYQECSHKNTHIKPWNTLTLKRKRKQSLISFSEHSKPKKQHQQQQQSIITTLFHTNNDLDLTTLPPARGTHLKNQLILLEWIGILPENYFNKFHSIEFGWHMQNRDFNQKLLSADLGRVNAQNNRHK